MTVAFLTDAIGVEIVTIDGVVEDVALKPAGASHVARAFVGRPAAAAAGLAEQLFSLCPMAQGVAAAAAAAAAAGVATVTPNRLVRLTAERVGENLRASVLSWPAADGVVGPDPATVIALRQAMAALRAVAGDPAGAGAAFGALTGAVEELGLGAGPVPKRSWFARMRRDAADDDGRFPGAAGARRLTAADDSRIFALLAKDAAISPADGLGAPRAAGNLADLVDARCAEMRAGLAELGALLAGARDFAKRIRATRAGEGHGLAAVDSPRGRLYHQARIGADGRVTHWRILSPTDWNFHPAGPFVVMLAGAEIGFGHAAETRVARLAALFDPCVALRARVREAAHA